MAPRPILELVGQALGDARHVGEFHRSFDRGMAGEDLLDQRRPRAGHAEDEDRVAAGASLAAARGEEFGRERPRRRRHKVREAGRLGIEQFAVEAVALGIMVEALA